MKDLEARKVIIDQIWNDLIPEWKEQFKDVDAGQWKDPVVHALIISGVWMWVASHKGKITAEMKKELYNNLLVLINTSIDEWTSGPHPNEMH